MRVTEPSQNSGGVGSETRRRTSSKRFSEVLAKERKQHSSEESKNTSAPPLSPYLLLHDLSSIEAKPTSATFEPGPLLSSLIQEITLQAPPEGLTSIDIRFESQTLEGLHVRIQKTRDGVNVVFSTSSEPVSRLLVSNVDKLSEALVRQGYVVPVVTVHKGEVSTTVSSGNENGRNRRRQQNQDRGQKRR